MDTPELDKKLAAQEDSQTIGEFLEWATHAGYHFTKTQTVEVEGETLYGKSYTYERGVEVPVGINTLLAEYFEIDLKKVDEESKAVLAEIRAKSAQDS